MLEVLVLRRLKESQMGWVLSWFNTDNLRDLESPWKHNSGYTTEEVSRRGLTMSGTVNPLSYGPSLNSKEESRVYVCSLSAS